MTDFFKDCYSNGFCKGRKNFVSTPLYARKLSAMPHSAEFYLRLRAMPLNVKYKSQIFLLTPRYAAKRRVANPRYAA
jgi:hypothetical protein